ncbi:hypothetical protein Tco_0681941 [Tanacetum coccineum]|uniref:Uncharacterized protein n=1 Tax=Tanacetum coccineum TaxID=301880 RepID=A0ABQ4XRD3_9ASTR
MRERERLKMSWTPSCSDLHTKAPLLPDQFSQMVSLFSPADKPTKSVLVYLVLPFPSGVIGVRSSKLMGLRILAFPLFGGEWLYDHVDLP